MSGPGFPEEYKLSIAIEDEIARLAKTLQIPREDDIYTAFRTKVDELELRTSLILTRLRGGPHEVTDADREFIKNASVGKYDPNLKNAATWGNDPEIQAKIAFSLKRLAVKFSRALNAEINKSSLTAPITVSPEPDWAADTTPNALSAELDTEHHDDYFSNEALRAQLKGFKEILKNGAIDQLAGYIEQTVRPHMALIKAEAERRRGDMQEQAFRMSADGELAHHLDDVESLLMVAKVRQELAPLQAGIARQFESMTGEDLNYHYIGEIKPAVARLKQKLDSETLEPEERLRVSMQYDFMAFLQNTTFTRIQNERAALIQAKKAEQLAAAAPPVLTEAVEPPAITSFAVVVQPEDPGLSETRKRLSAALETTEGRALHGFYQGLVKPELVATEAKIKAVKEEQANGQDVSVRLADLEAHAVFMKDLAKRTIRKDAAYDAQRLAAREQAAVAAAQANTGADEVVVTSHYDEPRAKKPVQDVEAARVIEKPAAESSLFPESDFLEENLTWSKRLSNSLGRFKKAAVRGLAALGLAGGLAVAFNQINKPSEAPAPVPQPRAVVTAQAEEAPPVVEAPVVEAPVAAPPAAEVTKPVKTRLAKSFAPKVEAEPVVVPRVPANGMQVTPEETLKRACETLNVLSWACK